MLNRCRFELGLMLAGGLLVAGCSVDNQGLEAVKGDASVTDVATDRVSPAGTGGRIGTGGTTVIGSGGGAIGAGGTIGIGSGGSSTTGTGGTATGGTATGGTAMGSGGGPTSSGGSVASGGRVGSGGAIGSGGAPGTGGDVAPGGTTGSGGIATGGAPGGGGGRGTGGATASCSALTCPNGCCMGGTCVTNRNDERCGTAGATCAPCSACSQCSNAGACALIASAQWNVVCVSATIAPTKPEGTIWDSSGTTTTAVPDPFCQLTLDGVPRTGARTPVLMDTLAPVWNQTITPTNGTNVTHNVLVAQPTRWSVNVIDDDTDTSGTNDPICTAAPRLTAADFAEGIVKVPATGSCTSLVIQLVCAEN